MHPNTNSLHSLVTNGDGDPAAQGSQPLEEVKDMGFIERGLINGPTPSPRKPTITETAKQLAKVHQKWCATKMWTLSRQRKKWSGAFQTLINQIGPDRVTKALTWYHNNHGDKDHQFRMRLRNGEEFRDHFDKLEDFIEKLSRTNPTVTISDTTKCMVRALSGLNWVKGSFGLLPTAVQLTLDSWYAFRKKLVVYCKTNPPEHSTGSPANLAHHLKQVLSYETFGIVENHFRNAQRNTEGWPTWSGDLLNRQFTWRGDLDDPEFTKIVMSMVTAYGCGMSTWKKLKEQLK